MTTADPSALHATAIPSKVRRYSRYALTSFLIVLVGIGGEWVRGKLQEHEIERFTRSYEQRGGRISRGTVNMVEEFTRAMGWRQRDDESIGMCVAPVKPFDVWDDLNGRLLRLADRKVVFHLLDAPIPEIEINQLATLKYVTRLRLPNTKLTPKLIQSLGSLRHLRILQMPDSIATDETLAQLCRALESHSQIIILELGETQVTEKGIQDLSRLKSLHGASLESPHIKDPKASFLATRGPK